MTRSFGVFFDLRLNKGWVNNREAGYLRRHRTHYDGFIDRTEPVTLPVSINILTHSGRVTHICVNRLTIIGSNHGLSPGRRQAIILINAGRLLIWPLGTNFTEILIEIHIFSFKKMHLKMSSGKWRPFVSASMRWTNIHDDVTTWIRFQYHMKGIHLSTWIPLIYDNFGVFFVVSLTKMFNKKSSCGDLRRHDAHATEVLCCRNWCIWIKWYYRLKETCLLFYWFPCKPLQFHLIQPRPFKHLLIK